MMLTRFLLAWVCLVGLCGAVAAQPASPERLLIYGGSQTSITGNTSSYLGVGRSTVSATEAFAQSPSPPLAGTLSTLYCFLGAAPGAGTSWALTLRVNEANTAVTCTISGTAQTCSDLVNQAPVSPGQRLSLGLVNTGATATTYGGCVLLLKPYIGPP